jgi:hypothetical protein
MQGAYGGLVVIMIYAVSEAASEGFFLITQDGLEILTQASENILVTE